MNTVSEVLAARNLPPYAGRDAAIATLLSEEYGILPSVDYTYEVGEPHIIDKRLVAGTVTVSEVPFTITTPHGSHTFHLRQMLHTDGAKHPFFVHISFQDTLASLYCPAEEIADRGYDVLSFCYREVTSDNGDFTDGLARLFYPDGTRGEHDAGKLMLWAFAARRVLDHAASLPMLDLSRAAVLGHSRLGKTALLAGMLDTRFAYVFSNDSGCSGAALSRGNLGATGALGEYGKTGESIAKITANFPYWFAPRYLAHREGNAPVGFDQHFLLSAIAPRHLYVASADMDDWADPTSEFLCCMAASPAFASLGKKGLVWEGGAAVPAGVPLHEGHIGYHKRHGLHFLSRYDWNLYMDYMDLHHNA